MIDDIGKRLENLLTEINILKDKRKEIDGKIKIKEQELENCCRELLSLQQELTSPHQPKNDVPQILSKYNTPEWALKEQQFLIEITINAKCAVARLRKCIT